MTATTWLDHPPAGWFPLDVMKSGSGRKWDWCALMINVDPDDFRTRRAPTAQEAWVRIPGKHRDKEAAWEALQDLLQTRH
jgi:hypothetical protein